MEPPPDYLHPTTGPHIRHTGRLIVLYWLIATLLGFIVLRDWLVSWQVTATLSQPWLLLYLLISLVLSQALYALVARHGGRPIHWGALVLFALGNGFAETLAFATTYRVGEFIGHGLFSLIAPASASIAGFIGGIICFTIYGGLIHALFWMPILPPHFDDSPRARMIRRLRPLAEVALVVGWSLCFWLFRDIWTVVALHILVDIGLMLLVRPPIFRASA